MEKTEAVVNEKQVAVENLMKTLAQDQKGTIQALYLTVFFEAIKDRNLPVAFDCVRSLEGK